jgi:GPH family glycoside/pentoside/hexuronide:cation symporter
MSASQAIDGGGAGDDLPRLTEQLSYVGGEFASNFAWNMVAGFLLFYYTDTAFLPVAALGTLMLVSRVLDAVIDPVVGILVDRTRTRWGHARPYLLFASVPFGILCVLTFSVPDWAPGAKVIYGYVTFTLLGLCYSLIYIPYGALQPMIVREPRLKVRIGSWRAMSTSLASIVVYSVVPAVLSMADAEHQRAAFTLAATIVAGITVALYLLAFAKCRERFVTTTAVPAGTVLRDLGRLARNPVWVFVFTYALLTFIRLGVLVSVTAYFANNVLKTPWILAVMLPLLSVAVLVGGFLSGFLLRRFGQRATNFVFLLISLALCLIMPGLEAHPRLFLAAFAGANVVGGIIGATIFISCADAVEFNEAAFGNRSEGLLFASVSFGMKVGVAIGAAATAYSLSWANYDPRALTPEATGMIRSLFYYGAAALSVLQIACVVFLKRDRESRVTVTA